MTDTHIPHHATGRDLAAGAAKLLAAGYRLALACAHDENDGSLRVVYLFTSDTRSARAEIHLRVDAERPELPSLAALSFPCGRFEREMHDQYGIVPLDHPLPRRLIRHPHWPRGWYPMRADAPTAPPRFAETEGPFPFLEVEGEGVYEIPVGPVHAGLIEPGHFRFSVVGETILKLKPRLWYVHKGIEKLFQGRTPQAGLPLAERISGDSAVGHALAYSLAVEEATETTVPPQAQHARALLLELERLYTHTTDLGALCNDVGHGILNAHALRIREQFLRVNEQVTGHRLLRGGVLLGGAFLRDLPDPERLAALGSDIREVAELALGHSTVRDRFTGTAHLPEQTARALGTLGYVARASGIPTDARRSHPFTDYPAFPVPVRATGDVLARFQIRAAEIDGSLGLISHFTEQLGAPGTWTTPLAEQGERSGVGITEGWRGTITTRVELAPDGTLARVKPVDPSFFNWPALPVALKDTIVPDFPLTNKSFNLSYAGNDL